MGQRVKYIKEDTDLYQRGWELLEIKDGLHHMRNVKTGELLAMTRETLELLGIVI